MHEVGRTDKVPRVVETPRQLLGQDRAMHDISGNPSLIDEKGDRGNIPHHLGPRIMVIVVTLEYLGQVIADGPTPLDILLDFGDRRR